MPHPLEGVVYLFEEGFMLAQLSALQNSTKIWHPVYIQADGKLGSLQIRALTGDDALCQKVIEFLENNPFEFYRNGRRYTHEDAEKTVDLLRTRFETGNPFSGFALLDKGKVVGLLRIGFDDDPRKIQIAGMGMQDYQNKGIGKKALDWILREYLPMLHSHGYRLPVFGSDGKTVKEWVDLSKTCVVATVHPDHHHCNHLLSKAGFTLVKQVKVDDFSGIHDGRRNVYEIAIKRFLKP